MCEFLERATARMVSPELRKQLADRVNSPVPGDTMIQLQRQCWDDLGIDRDVGCRTLGTLETIFPGDPELTQKRQLFMEACQRQFLVALEDRQPEKLEKKKPIPKQIIIEFFNACNTKLSLPETHEQLVKYMEVAKKAPNQPVIEMQRHMLEVLGWDAEHGVAMLNNLAKDFGKDQEVVGQFQNWQLMAKSACMRAVKEFQQKNVAILQSDPEMQKVRGMAQERIAAMTPLERGTFLIDGRQRLETFGKMTVEEKKGFLEKQTQDDKVEMMMTQMLIMSTTHQMHQQENHPGCEMHGAGGGGGCADAHSSAAPATAPDSQAMVTSTPSTAVAPTTHAPSQQEMM